MQSVLIVDDEKHTRDGLSAVLADTYDVFAAADADEAIRMLDAENFDAVITDLRLAGKSGLSVIDKTASMPHRPVCIMLTAYGSVETAVEAMKRGAADFLPKPVDVDKLERVLKDALSRRAEAERAASDLTAKRAAEFSAHADSARSAADSRAHSPLSEASFEAGGIVARSPEMKAVIAEALQVARSKATVMLTGETGTGKELVARLIHDSSPRKNMPFLPVHCAAIPSNLLESELFGYEKGAFTGANQRRMGRFEAADGGTLFLDEIGEIDAATQVKLLRFLETRSFERLGSVQTIPVDVRLICATNRNLAEMSQNGSFREDLYYRLNVVEIKIPPLREHREDIPPLLKSYVNFYAKDNGVEPIKILPDAMKILSEYDWPGNIRELRNFCENAVVMQSASELSAKDLEEKYSERKQRAPSVHPDPESSADFPPVIHSLSKKENEASLIKKALEATGGNKSKAAELLGISRRTLHRKLADEKQE